MYSGVSMEAVKSEDYLSDSNEDTNFNSPVGAPMPPGGGAMNSSAPHEPNVLQESIYYNNHVIPKNATFKVE